MHLLKTALLFTIIVTISTCDVFNNEEEAKVKYNPQEYPHLQEAPIELSLQSEEISRPDSIALKFKLLVHNPDSTGLWLQTGGTPEENYYEFVVTRPDCTLVWNRLPSVRLALAVDLKLDPGETRIFEHVWDLSNNNGHRVEKGTYLLFGGLEDVSELDSTGNIKTDYGNIGVGDNPKTINIK